MKQVGYWAAAFLTLIAVIQSVQGAFVSGRLMSLVRADRGNGEPGP